MQILKNYYRTAIYTHGFQNLVGYCGLKHHNVVELYWLLRIHIDILVWEKLFNWLPRMFKNNSLFTMVYSKYSFTDGIVIYGIVS